MPEQRGGGRPTAAEVVEHILRRAAASKRQHSGAEAPTCGLYRRLVVKPRLLKGCKRIGGKDLRPLVGVVSVKAFCETFILLPNAESPMRTTGD